ncbi:MAG TPA: DUF481 domain-containing protein [Proteobacteria bacterium]|mgnify:CR=1 FL=1|nr:DUF481 domain-containing protein [Pseudomonadota bacterium]
MRAFSLLFLFFILFIPMTVSADTIVLSNGDRLTGKVTEFSQGRLKVKTEYAAEIKVDWQSISALETEGAFFIQMEGDEALCARIKADEKGWSLIDQNGVTHSIAKVHIKRFSSERPKYWTMQFDLGYQKTSGNSTSNDLRTEIKARMKRQRDNLLLGAAYARGKTGDEVSTDRWDLRSKYSHLPNKKLYGSANFYLERNRVRDIDQRWQIGPAIGCRFYDTEKFFLSSDIGVVWEKTRYEPSGSESKLKGLLGIDFSYVPLADIRIEETFRWIQSSTEGSDYEISSETDVYIPIYDGLFLKASLIDRYDNKPQPGLKRNDLTFLTSLSYLTSF